MSKINGGSKLSTQQVLRKMRVTVIIPTVYKTDLTDIRLAIESLSQPTSNLTVTFYLFVDAAPAGFVVKDFVRSLAKPGRTIKCAYAHTRVGFTGAVNQALELASKQLPANWYLVFNDDATATSRFWQLTTVLRRQQTGVVSCAVATSEGKIDSNGLATNWWGITLPITTPPQKNQPQSRWFSGTCFFIAESTVKQLLHEFGFVLFPDFFAYAEDFELSVRLQRMQTPVTIVPLILVNHKGSRTAKRGSQFQLFYGLRNDWWVHVLHESSWCRLGKHLLWSFGYIWLLSWYKGYWLLPVRIVGSTYRHWSTLRWCQHSYDQKLHHTYSF